MENQYNDRHAREILEPSDRLKPLGLPDKNLRLDERGVWPAIERDPLLLTETELLRWRPARELQHLPGAPEVKDTPMLPNPFTARELAAFMLEGTGALVADFYGDWNDGPDPDSLRAIDLDSRARRAVIEAFDAYSLAIEKVGKSDADALARRDAAHTAYRKSSNDKVLLKAFEDAEAEWHAANQAWLTAMVVFLLEPKPQAATEAPAVAVSTSDGPVSDTATPAPVVRVKAKPRTLWEVSTPYIVAVMKAGQYATAKEIYRVLEERAGPDSPFDKGSGNNRGSLYVRELAQSLSLKSVQNKWAGLRELAQKHTQ